ncbi:MAG: hypothetical protein ABII89_05000 [Candidatus Omnitrophota bacterium]
MVYWRFPWFAKWLNPGCLGGVFSFPDSPESIRGNLLELQIPVVQPDSNLSFEILQNGSLGFYQGSGGPGEKKETVTPGNGEIFGYYPLFPESKHPV